MSSAPPYRNRAPNLPLSSDRNSASCPLDQMASLPNSVGPGSAWMPGAGARCSNQRIFVLAQPKVDPSAYFAMKRAVARRLAVSYRKSKILNTVAERSRLSKIHQRAQRDYYQALSDREEAAKQKKESAAALEKAKKELIRALEKEEKEKDRRKNEWKISVERIKVLKKELAETTSDGLDLIHDNEHRKANGYACGIGVKANIKDDESTPPKSESIEEASNPTEVKSMLKDIHRDATVTDNIVTRRKIIKEDQRYDEKVTLEILKEKFKKGSDGDKDREDLLPSEKKLKRVFSEMADIGTTMQAAKEEIDRLNQTKSELIW
eukprot:CAMPEP_0113313068 /NCGR_PEP_ID=MMETSP0010_2-20120614/9638_1 /TAXON_ID=216773 ORGANISM="Corethron hystrix, Strain 308" /NCGR_SAMPLE_ID=MMETSP0010_2 /ASSEMBLY_ACC=CAM_ASM_000155 /LENGTH=320 /DNA_ID=CAMNT_0000169003 /DNA_START=68 /DNA_END=1027 /DNA_ORIENTATION=+ /assembly_acc=CAM_ASM_000155